MAKYCVEDTTFSDIADAIREKTGDTATLTPLAMPAAIKGITGGGSGGEIEWYFISGDTSRTLEQLKANVSDLDKLACLILGVGTASSYYPYVYTKGNGSRDNNKLYCSYFSSSAYYGYVSGDTTTYINLDATTAEEILFKNGSAMKPGSYAERYIYGVYK